MIKPNVFFKGTVSHHLFYFPVYKLSSSTKFPSWLLLQIVRMDMTLFIFSSQVNTPLNDLTTRGRSQMEVSRKHVTHRCIDLNEGDVRFLVHVFDFRVVEGAALQLHFHPVLVGHHVGIGHNLAILCHNEARTAGHCHLSLGIGHPVE